ncbi:MAG: N-acetylmuramoyl-L-alanine amidase [Myxococcota bacterium]|nr:N-acetylmuramoyl-L-alanine amidase [Myxococcota bacterium]
MMRSLAGRWLCLGLALTAPASALASSEGTLAEGIAGCGLEPPGSPDWGPPPRRPFELPAGVPLGPLVRRVPPEVDQGLSPRLAQGPWGPGGAGFLAGKTVYLSPGHGFTSISYGWRTQRGNTHGLVEDLVSAEAVQQYLLRYLRQAGARVVTVREADLNPSMVIVDELDRGAYQELGAGRFTAGPPGWGRPPGPLTGQENPFALGRSRLLLTAPRADARAVFIPDVPESGEYNVYVAYTSAPSRAPDAHYVVRHPGGEAHFRVDQRRHGGTWILLGRFYFRKGRSAELGSVRLENDSAVPGTAVSIDAVRLGGGTGLHDRGKGLSRRPRWEECARYHAQFSGAPPSVYDIEELDDRSDDVGTRSRFAAWDHEDGEDAVYLSWHTNAPNPGVGTSSYVYGPNPPDGSYHFTGVPGSDVLMRLVHDEIVSDLRKGWDPGWRDRGRYTAYFGEVNPRHNPEMPAALIEVAFHDTPSDAQQLRQPGFRRIVARAMYQGIAKFFAQKDGTLPLLLPEPPVAVCARGSGPGQVTLSWRPAEPGPPGLGGDPAEWFRIYRSADGLSWDEGTEVKGTQAVVDGLPPGGVIYFRVAAMNRGGESFPSPLLPVRPRRDGGPARLLLVGGFDRLDGDMLVRQDLSAHALGTVQRMLLDLMNDGTYLAAHARALAQVDMGFDACERSALDAGDVRLTDYAAVDWQAGEQSVGPERALSHRQRELLMAYLRRGGRLILSGSEIFWALLDQGNDQERALGAALGVTLLDGDAGTYQVRPVRGRLFDGLPAFQLDDGSHGVYDVDQPDVLAPRDGAQLELVYGTAQGAAAISSGMPTQVVSFGFPLEAVYDEQVRTELMVRSLRALGVPPDPEPMDRPPPMQEGLGEDLREAGCACHLSPRATPTGSGLLVLLVLLPVLRRRIRWLPPTRSGQPARPAARALPLHR